MINLFSTVLAVDLGTKFNSPWGKTLAFGNLITLILNSAISIGGIIVLFTFIFGGINVIRGAGSNDPKASAQGKLAVTYAIYGFIIVFTAFWFIKIIEVMTGSTFLTDPFAGS